MVSGDYFHMQYPQVGYTIYSDPIILSIHPAEYIADDTPARFFFIAAPA